MIYGSVCSGIEAATAGWHPLGWRPAFFSEIEAFPRAVLKHHYPEVPCHGDFTTIGADDYGPIDILVGGTPCQDFSVAGLRAGIAGERGNLTLEFLRLAARKKPAWIVWENVPGVLSSDGGRALGAFLGGLAELGYGFAYRVLDAQYFGLAQRRARVFVVGYLGDWRRAAAVLFERESLCGDTPPRREAGERTAPSLAPGTGGGSGHQYQQKGNEDALISVWPAEIAPTLNATFGDKQGLEDQHALNGAGLFVPGVTHALRAEGFDASEDEMGRGTPLVPVAFDTTQITSAANYSNPRPGDPCHPLAAGAHPPAIAFGWQNSSKQGASASASASVTPTLDKSKTPAVCFSVKDHGADAGDLSPTLRAGGFDKSHANGGVMPAVAFDLRGREGGAQFKGPHDTANIRAADGGSSRSYVASSAVRRLTPRECERLQGFPDVRKTVTIRVCSDLQKHSAPAASQNHRSPSSAGPAAGRPYAETASSAERLSSASLHRTSRHAVVRVEIDCEAGTISAAIHEKELFASVRIADESARTFLATPLADFALLSASVLSWSDPITEAGRAASPQNIRGSTAPKNGEIVAVVSGQDIAGTAPDVEKNIGLLRDHMKFTTSELGQNSQSCGLSFQILCCSAMAAIASFIPEQIKNDPTYDLELSILCSYTLVPYRGKPAADGPRYKALGNSMAVPVMRWIGERIKLAAGRHKREEQTAG